MRVCGVKFDEEEDDGGVSVEMERKWKERRK